MRLILGRYKGKEVASSNDVSTNGHICVVGESGSGKTVECQKLMTCAAKQGATIIAFDMHGALSSDQIFWKYKEIWKEYLRDVNVCEGIPCDLFTSIMYPDGTEEDVYDMVSSITDVLADAIKAGSRQRSELRSALHFVAESGGYEREGLHALDEALALTGNSIAENVRERLACITKKRIFVPGAPFIESGKINVFRIARFSPATQKLVVEILLLYIWRLALAEQFKKKPIYLFIDEFQNLPTGPNNALAQLISEGRKFGLNLILATQILPSGNTSAVYQRVMQCAVKLYFKPASNKVNATAKLINPFREGEWARILRTLGVGEFVAEGNFLLEGWSINEPLKVSAYEEEDMVETESEQSIEHMGRGSVRCNW